MIAGRPVLAPKVLVRISSGGPWSPATLAVVDTGSPATLVSTKFAKQIGWVQPLGEPAVALAGLGRQGSGWMTRMHISFVFNRTQKPELGLVLSDSVAVVTDLLQESDMLIGQHDTLERLRFIQRNQAPHKDFELMKPEE